VVGRRGEAIEEMIGYAEMAGAASKILLVAGGVRALLSQSSGDGQDAAGG